MRAHTVVLVPACARMRCNRSSLLSRSKASPGWHTVNAWVPGLLVPKSCAAGASLQVTSVQAGDWVVPLTSALGTWRDTGVWQAADWHKLPAGLPLAAAATLAINPPTALLMLEDVVPLQPGGVVVQNGATSGVGQVRVAWLALALAKMDAPEVLLLLQPVQATCVGFQRPGMATPCTSI